MKKIRIIAGIAWAFLSLLVILVLFPGLNTFSESLAKLPFMHINPNYSGGEIAHQVTAGNYAIDIRKPVFDGLSGQRKKGFVQIDWRGNLPEEIVDTVDYDLDNKPDFRIRIVRGRSSTELTPFDSRVGDAILSTATSYGWSVRVALRK
jgi:hypothetical protein